MLWLPLSLLTALSESLKDVAGKKALTEGNVYITGLAYRLFALPIVLPLLFFWPVPEIKPLFYLALLGGGLLNVLVTVLYMKALKASDLSSSVPLLTFTPLFMLLTSPLMLGEYPGIAGGAGIVLIVAGAYMLNYKQASSSFVHPFIAIVQNKGSRYMLIIAFIWSITANFDKMGVVNSSPVFWVVSISVFLSGGMFVTVLFKVPKQLGQLRNDFSKLIPVGFFGAVGMIAQMFAVQLTLVSYVIAIKRSSALFSVVWGHLFFKERGFGSRVVGTLLMLAGVGLIALWG